MMLGTTDIKFILNNIDRLVLGMTTASVYCDVVTMYKVVTIYCYYQRKCLQ